MQSQTGKYKGKFPIPPHVPKGEKIQARAELLDPINRKKVSLKKNIFFFLGSRLLKILVELIYFSSKEELSIHPEANKLINDPTGQFIIGIWHNRLLYSVFSLRQHIATKGHDILAIISESDDGELIARTTELWGGFTSRGSSSRGGTRALKKLLRYVSLHFHPLITPDGPRGPMYTMHDGLITLARLSKLPVIPIAYDCRRKWIFSSWDRFIVPKFFAKVFVEYGEPIIISTDFDEEQAKAHLHNHMMLQIERLSQRVDSVK